MKLTIPFTYTETEVPPRCRKPRPVKHEDSVVVEIREIDQAEAPVAIIERSEALGGTPCRLHRVTVPFRWYDNRLWCRESSWNRGRGEKYKRPGPKTYHNDRPYLDGRSRDQRLADIKRWADSYLIIGGQTYRPEGEPLWVVMTFGLGHNHGGTALMVHYDYNDNIGKARYFPLTEREAAIAEATRIATARGDTKDLPIRPFADFEILIPEVIRRNPQVEHGDGDPFLNSVYEATERAGHPVVAAVWTMALLAKEMKA